MPVDQKMVEAARSRRLKEPLSITGYSVTASKILAAGEPRTQSEMVVRQVETIGDLARLDAHIKVGKFIPVPDLGLQALNIVIDKLGLLEPAEKEGVADGA